MTMSSPEIKSLLESVPWDRGVVQKVYEADAFSVVFQIRIPGETVFLLWSAARGAARFHRVETKPKQPQHPTGFTMACRKYLTGRFDPPSYEAGEVEDRVVTWRFGESALIAEIGRHGVLCVVDPDRRVLSHTPNPPARVNAGEPFIAPEKWPTARDKDRFDGDHASAASHYSEIVSTDALVTEKRILRKSLKTAKKAFQRKLKNLERDLEKCVEADGYQKRGTLLQQAYGSVERGADLVTVQDYYDPELPEVTIPIDPTKSLQKNIDRYFHQYKRLTRAFDSVSQRLEAATEQVSLAEQFSERLEQLSTVEGIESLREEAIQKKLLKRPIPKAKKEKIVKLPYRVFTSQRGVAIWVGRGAKDNDVLSTKFTRGKDVWMHAKNWAGAHVVLKTTLQSATSEDLLDAAVLAAHFSKGSSDSTVEVTYTEGKHVRKPKGAAPGLVTVSGGKTLIIRPDDPRLAELMQLRQEF